MFTSAIHRVDTKPIELDWYTIRGVDVTLNETVSTIDPTRYYSNGQKNDYTWPDSANVDANSLMGKLRSRTKLRFDLPTEAQWERACRGGSITPIYIGTEDSDESRAKIKGDPKLDPTGTHMLYVGLYLPNAYGLYDTQGNVREWCLDVYVASLGADPTTDPVGPSTMSTSEWHDYNLSSNWSIYCYLNGYERVVRGSGSRSAARGSCLVLNFSGDQFKTYASYFGWTCTNPTAGVRVVVNLD